MSIRKRRLPNNHHFYSAKRTGEGIALSYIGSDWMVDKLIYEPKELEYLAYEEDVTARYEEFKQSLSSENITSIDYARNAGVQNEWETYQFFAQEEVNAPRDIFVYINDEGEPDYFTNDQIEAISEWKKGDPAPVEGIEMHHMELVSHHKDNIDLAASPDNILAATETGHRMHLHGGNTQNATNPDYFQYSLTTDEQFSRTLQYNHDEITLNAFEYGAYAIGFSAGMYTAISLGLESLRLKDDPRPWSEKRRSLINVGIATSIFGLGLSGVGYVTKLSVNELFGSFSVNSIDHALPGIFALNSSFLAITAAGGLLKMIWDVRRGRAFEEAKKDFQSVMMVATAEFLAFSALGIGLDFLVDYAGDTLLDALIPDPTGLLIAARLGYSVFKLGRKAWTANENKKSVQECLEIRFRFLEDQALRFLDSPRN